MFYGYDCSTQGRLRKLTCLHGLQGVSMGSIARSRPSSLQARIHRAMGNLTSSFLHLYIRFSTAWRFVLYQVDS